MTRTGFRVLVTPWTDRDLENKTYYPMRPGYASTVIKFQSSTIEHGADFVGKYTERTSRRVLVLRCA